MWIALQAEEDFLGPQWAGCGPIQSYLAVNDLSAHTHKKLALMHCEAERLVWGGTPGQCDLWVTAALSLLHTHHGQIKPSVSRLRAPLMPQTLAVEGGAAPVHIIEETVATTLMDILSTLAFPHRWFLQAVWTSVGTLQRCAHSAWLPLISLGEKHLCRCSGPCFSYFAETHPLTEYCIILLLGGLS